MKLFVYGTLKKGYQNSYYLKDAKFLGEFTTDPIFSMYSFGAYPGVSENGNTAIIGEIYEVDKKQLASIDCLEWYPHYYQRVKIETSFGEVWMYVVNQQRCAGKIATNGIWP
jgi:gamma-glutamylcyclotransferase (GGCT)/AIG2-like uncharacterized protein YtfP